MALKKDFLFVIFFLVQIIKSSSAKTVKSKHMNIGRICIGYESYSLQVKPRSCWLPWLFCIAGTCCPRIRVRSGWSGARFSTRRWTTSAPGTPRPPGQGQYYGIVMLELSLSYKRLWARFPLVTLFRRSVLTHMRKVSDLLNKCFS
jgi:hypothetical protein